MSYLVILIFTILLYFNNISNSKKKIFLNNINLFRKIKLNNEPKTKIFKFNLKLFNARISWYWYCFKSFNNNGF